MGVEVRHLGEGFPADRASAILERGPWQVIAGRQLSEQGRKNSQIEPCANQEPPQSEMMKAEPNRDCTADRESTP